jgi:cyclophilin family peptidyl-prolyl cis-trans isomerase
MVQGGGMTADMHEKSAKPPIKNEAANGLKNKRGTLAMARTPEIDSATCQFFINLVDNTFLDHKSNNPEEFGYAVFGKVVAGMDVVDAIAGVATGSKGGHQDVPREPVTILSASRLESK